MIQAQKQLIQEEMMIQVLIKTPLNETTVKKVTQKLTTLPSNVIALTCSSSKSKMLSWYLSTNDEYYTGNENSTSFVDTSSDNEFPPFKLPSKYVRASLLSTQPGNEFAIFDESSDKANVTVDFDEENDHESNNEMVGDESSLRNDFDDGIAESGQKSQLNNCDEAKEQNDKGLNDTDRNTMCKEKEGAQGINDNPSDPVAFGKQDSFFRKLTAMPTEIDDEAWTSNGISALASRLGKPLVMDNVTAEMCKMGVGRVGHARVLVEVSANKCIPKVIDVVYRDKDNKEMCKKQVQVHLTKNGELGKKNVADIVNESDVGVKENDCFTQVRNRKTNGEGLSTSTKQREVIKLLNEEKLSICAILETHLKNKNLCWNSDVVNLTLIHEAKQSIFCLVEAVNGQFRSYCTIVYAANTGNERKKLWGDLNRYKHLAIGNPWFLGGDFNVTLKVAEHSAGTSVMTSDMHGFYDCINQIKVEDMCSSRLNFTWTKNLHKVKKGDFS
ncbi:RNA-directed DNA polymerase, eukaryota, reverse transcriptase zinc-binding domain protein [Tanacetum coccineum]